MIVSRRSSPKMFVLDVPGHPLYTHIPFPYRLLDNDAIRREGGYLEQRVSPLGGNGLFVTKDLTKNDVISVSNGNFYLGLLNGTPFRPVAEDISNISELRQTIAHYEVLSERNRNIFCSKDDVLYATRDLKNGEELIKNYDVEFWLIEMITVSEFTVISRRLGKLIAQYLDQSRNPTVRIDFNLKYQSKYPNWTRYWNNEAEHVIAYGEAYRATII